MDLALDESCSHIRLGRRGNGLRDASDALQLTRRVLERGWAPHLEGLLSPGQVCS